MDKKEPIKELASYITVGIFFAYVIGYLVVTGYLTRYHVINDDLLNINFLKTGIVFLIILVPILFIINSYFNYLVEVFSIIFLYAIALSILFIEFKPLYFIDYFLYLILYFLFIKDKNAYKKFIFSIILPLILLVILSFNYEYLLSLYLLIITLLVFSFVLFVFRYLFKINKPTFGYLYFIAQLFWSCIIAFYFGTHIYGDLPKSFKGGFPESTSIICKKESRKYLNKLGFNFNDSTYVDNVEILYSSNDKLLICREKEIYFLSKDLFNGFKKKE